MKAYKDKYLRQKYISGSAILTLVITLMLLVTTSYGSERKHRELTGQVSELQSQLRAGAVVANSYKEMSEGPQKIQILYRIPENLEDQVEMVWGDKADEALEIARCESSLNSEATNLNTNGTMDKGIMQVNSIHGVDPRFLEDPMINLLVARKIYEDANGWTPWVCDWVLQ